MLKKATSADLIAVVKKLATEDEPIVSSDLVRGEWLHLGVDAGERKQVPEGLELLDRLVDVEVTGWKRANASAKSLVSITHDLQRIVESWSSVGMIKKPAAVYGLMIATTWQQELARWWPDSNKHPSSELDARWSNPVASVTESARSVWGNVAFSSYFSEQYPHHYLLYALFPLT